MGTHNQVPLLSTESGLTVHLMYLHVSGFMSELEYDVLSEWFSYLVHSADIRAVDLFGNCRSLSLLIKI